MAALQKTYRLAPNWDFPPDGDIALGSVIKNPKQPHLPLLRDPPDDALITMTKRTDFVFSRGSDHDSRGGLWFSTLALITGLNADASANASKHERDTFRFRELETRYFNPTDRLIAARLYHADVVDYTSNHSWRSVYIITGVKIAHGATMETTIKQGYGGELKAGFDGTTIGVPASIGPEGHIQHERNETIRFGAHDGFVFAYQLLKLQPRDENKQSFKAHPFNSGALLGEEYSKNEYNELFAERLYTQWDIIESAAAMEVSSSETAVQMDDLDCTIILS